MNVYYDVILKHHPTWGVKEEPKYLLVFYDTEKAVSLREMRNYVKQHGFMTPDGKESIADVILREREGTGEVISMTSYCELFDCFDMPLNDWE